MTTSLKERTAVTERPAIKVRPPAAPKRPRKLIRWIEYAAVAIVVAAASIVGVIMLTGDDEALPFDVEAGSLLIIGERHINPDFEIASRWVGESDVTLEEFQARFDSFGTLYEAESLVVIGSRHLPGFELAPRFLGESDMTLADFEAVFDGFGTLYEAKSLAVIGSRHVAGFELAPRFLGESDMTLEEYEASQ